MIAPQMTAVTTATKRQTPKALQSKQGVIYPVGERVTSYHRALSVTHSQKPDIFLLLYDKRG